MFRGFISPEIASESNFDLESHLVLNSLATASVANKSNLVLAQSFRPDPKCLQTVLPVFSLALIIIILHPTMIEL